MTPGKKMKVLYSERWFLLRSKAIFKTLPTMRKPASIPELEKLASMS
jgi:hypothetical protein